MATEHPSRRTLLGHTLAWTALALGADPVLAGTATPASPARDALRVITAWNAGEQSWAGLWTPGHKTRGVALPARAHQVITLPASAGRSSVQTLVLARRPGEYLLRMDPLRARALQWHRMEEDRYLGGHAVLAADGRRFFTTETDATNGQGLIVERDLLSLEARREFPSGGIGPHALLLLPDGDLLVANGGILNLPETGRRKLNIGSMAPNLTRLDAATGSIRAQYRLEDSFLSLRHLALAPGGTVAVALQAEHPHPQARALAPALALLEAETLRATPWDASRGAPPGWDGYAADVCFAENRFWVSAPRAGCLACWSVDGDPLGSAALPGAGALAAGAGQWIAAGDDTALLYRASAPPRRYSLPTAWDNHAELLFI